MLSDAPPSRELVTTSRTWRDSVEVKTLTNSGMIAPASVPQVMMRRELPPERRVAAQVGDQEVARRRRSARTETIEVSHTSRVSGDSKFIFVDAGVLAPWRCASLMK